MHTGSVTITVPFRTTQEEIKKIRELFAKNETMKGYRLNILVSGEEEFQENLLNFVKAMVNP